MDEDKAWEPPDYDSLEQEEMLGYDASYNPEQVGPHPTFKDATAVPKPAQRENSLLSAAAEEHHSGLEPTQRLSQVCSDFATLCIR